MANHTTKRIGPDYASKVYPQVKDAILDGWKVYGQSGYARIGCTEVDTIEVYLVKEKEVDPGKSLMPVELEDSREA